MKFTKPLRIKYKTYVRKSGVYSFKNKISGKRYIGKAKCLYHRHWKHLNGQSGAPKLENAVKKYGWDNFEFEILEECPIDLLEEREEYWILFYKTLDDNFGYNIVQRQKGHPISEETKQKIRESFKIAFPNGRSGPNNPMYGKKYSLEERKEMSEGRKGHIGYNRVPVRAFNEKEEKSFACLKHAEQFVNGHREFIVRAIKNSSLYKEYYWKYD